MPERIEISPRCKFEMGKLVLRLEVISSHESVIDGVVPRITGVIEKRGCAGDDLDKIDLALLETLANAILHRSQAGPQRAVRVCVGVEDDCRMPIVVKDAGSSFGLNQLPNPVMGRNIWACHGRGVFLTNQLVDEVRFAFESGTSIYITLRAPGSTRERREAGRETSMPHLLRQECGAFERGALTFLCVEVFSEQRNFKS
jgi:anti-sigma regulatory factor (Ser/Thr protein kinase)